MSARAGDDAWTVHSPLGVQVHNLTATASQADRLYAASRGSGVYRSDDGGDSWSAVNGGLDNLDISAIAASPLNANLVVVAQVDGAMQVSADGGASWNVGDGGEVGSVSAVSFDPRDDQVIYALDGDAVLRSADRGLTWRRDTLGTTLNAVAFAPDQPAVYIGSDTGLFESTDGGDTWTAVAGPDEFGGWWFGSSRIIALSENAEAFSVIGLAAEETGSQAFRMPAASGRLPTQDAASLEAIRAAERIAFDLSSDDPYLARALLAGPNGIHGSVDAGARDSLETRFYGGANHWLPLNAGLHSAGTGGYEVTALLFDPATARRYFVVVDGAVMRYDGKVGVDLRLGGRPEGGFEDPALLSPICCYDTDDGGKRLEVLFTLGNRSAETATDVELRFTVDPPVQFSASLRDQSATVMPFECSEVSAEETVCTVSEFPRGAVEGIANIVAHEAGEYRLTVTANAAERDPTPGSNSAVQMFTPDIPEAAEEAPPAEDPPAETDDASETGDADTDTTTESGDEAAPPPPPSPPPTSAPAADAGSGGAGSLSGLSVAMLTLLIAVGRRRIPK